MLVYSPFKKINFHELGRYFSINFVNCSNENGFLNISLTPVVFHLFEQIPGSDEAVNITIFFDSISRSCRE